MKKKPTLNRIVRRDIKFKTNPPEKNDNGQILYMSSNAGFTKKPEGEPIHYFGLTSTIPIQSYPFNIFEHEINMADLFTVIKDSSRDLIPLKDGIIERYEIQDLNSYDVHVMYRVPYVRYP